MPFDLALSQYGDLIFAGNRDLEYVDGDQLVNQRIINRLRIKRGSWIFNRDSSLGSDLDTMLGKSFEHQLDNIPSLVSTALEPMNEEIEIKSLDVSTTVHGVTIIISYSRIQPNTPPELTLPTTELLIPLGMLGIGVGDQGD
jgi:phage baseplate assembly protein W